MLLRYGVLWRMIVCRSMIIADRSNLYFATVQVQIRTRHTIFTLFFVTHMAAPLTHYSPPWPTLTVVSAIPSRAVGTTGSGPERPGVRLRGHRPVGLPFILYSFRGTYKKAAALSVCRLTPKTDLSPEIKKHRIAKLGPAAA